MPRHDSERPPSRLPGAVASEPGPVRGPPGALDEAVNLPGGQVSESLAQAFRPLDIHALRQRGVTEPEVEAEIVHGAVARPGVQLGDLRHAPGGHLDEGADAMAVPLP